MIRITITHVRTSPDGSTTTTIDDEFLGLIQDLADRHRSLLAALAPGLAAQSLHQADDDEPVSPALQRRLAELPVSTASSTVDSMDRLDAETARLKPPTVIPATADHAQIIVSTAPRPVEPWTGTKLFSWAKHKPGALEFVQSYGAQHGFPRRILEWSGSMCNLAHAAWKTERSVA